MPPRGRQILAALILLGTSAPPAAAQADGEKVQAAMFFAMGAIAYGECRKLGFAVNPNGWHALLEHTAPGTTAADFASGGRFEPLGRASTEHVGKIIAEAGQQVWCTYIAAWAKAAHPRIWSDLIRK